MHTRSKQPPLWARVNHTPVLNNNILAFLNNRILALNNNRILVFLNSSSIPVPNNSILVSNNRTISIQFRVTTLPTRSRWETTRFPRNLITTLIPGLIPHKARCNPI